MSPVTFAVALAAPATGHHCRLVLLARRGHIVHWGREGLRGLVPEADSYLFVCLFPRTTEPGRGAAPLERKRNRKLFKGMMR